MMLAETSIAAYRSFTVPDLQKKEREVMAEFAACPGLTVTRERQAGEAAAGSG
ncbi:MAG: hypothetical protein ABL877_10940 [Thiobacillus sp.]